MNIDVDVDVDDVYYEMSRRDKEEMVALLAEDGYCVPLNDVTDSSGSRSLLDDAWHEQIVKLMNARLRLTTEQEEQILQIIKTFNL